MTQSPTIYKTAIKAVWYNKLLETAVMRLLSNTSVKHKSILIKHIVGLFVCLSVCLFVCLFEIANLFRLKAERHETRHVGPLCTREGFRPNGFLNFDLKV